MVLTCHGSATSGAWGKRTNILVLCTRNSARPIWPGAPVRGHWGVEDPAAAAKPDWEVAFEIAYGALEQRAQACVAANIHAMDRAE